MDEGDPSCWCNQWDKHIDPEEEKKDSRRRRTAGKRQEETDSSGKKTVAVKKNILKDQRTCLTAERLLNN